MKGRRLYHLLQEISTKDKKRIIHSLAFSKDKRATFFEQILKDDFKDNEDLHNYLSSLFESNSTNNDAQETDKAIRRFVDYANKHIEDLLLTNHLLSHKTDRMKLLNDIVAEGDNDYLQNYYLSKTITQAKKDDDNILHNQYLDYQIQRYGQDSHNKNVKYIKELLAEKKRYLNYAQHEQLSFYYRLLSATLVDESILDDNRLIRPKANELDKLASDSMNDFYAIDYKITKARFAFFEKEFEQYLQEASDFLQQFDLKNKEKDILKGRILSLNMIHGFNSNQPLPDLMNFATQVMALNERLKFNDGKTLFYYLMFLVMNGELEQCKAELKEKSTLFFKENKVFYGEFIEALLLLKESRNGANKFDKLNKSLNLFSSLKFAPNYYISLWASLFEFLIQHLKGNYIICKDLIERLKGFLYQHKNMEYSFEASYYIYSVFRTLLSKRKLTKEQPTLSILHQFILACLDKEK